MRMYQDTRRLDFHALGREIKRKREAKGWTQEYLAQLVDRTPRSIMYFENRGQHPSLNTFYQIVTLLDISVDQFFYPEELAALQRDYAALWGPLSDLLKQLSALVEL